MGKGTNIGNRQLKRVSSPIPVIDLFAGPGGLGEGFSSLCDEYGNHCFKIVLSIEKEQNAHQTLELRSFFREFGSSIPEEYYSYIKGEITREELYRRYPAEAKAAASIAWHAELGSSSFPDELVDQRISDALHGAKNWVLIGGPPCQAYSVIGRSRIRSSDPKRHERYAKDPRHFLYREYLRILAVHLPPVFIMENVQGILSTRIDGTSLFSNILFDLRDPCEHSGKQTTSSSKASNHISYRLYSLTQSPNDNVANPASFVVKMKYYGVPQDRRRVIVLGVRSDVDVTPNLLRKSKKVATLKSVIGDLPKLRSGLSKTEDSNRNWQGTIEEIASHTDGTSVGYPLKAKLLAYSGRALHTLPRGGQYMHYHGKPSYLPDWYKDDRLEGVCSHHSRSHMMADIQRYFFASCFATSENRSPLLKDFPDTLLPHHKNARQAVQNKNGLFSDRFRVQLWNSPATTITSHIAKDGHYFIHPDPLQCRSLTVREAARLQTFPDNYFFEGNQTSQYQQVGNAVPPLLAHSIAKIGYHVFLKMGNEKNQMEFEF
jgi:DNA (cytosine-5)-methyltransferase 1